MNYHKLRFLKYWVVPLMIFGLALVIRVSALEGFLTIDEPHWIQRSRWFMTGLLFADKECPPVKWGREFATHSWGCTFQIGYPGVTTMWGGSLGLWLYYRQEVQPTGVDLRTFLQTLRIHPAINQAIIAPIRLPFAVVGALFVLFFYLLLRRLLTERIALGAALLVALHPFHIGLSRVIHHDSLNTMFMVLSLLTLIGYWVRGWPRYWLLISAIMGGMAFLSKQVSWFMIPYVGVLAGLTLYYRRQSPHWQGWADVRRLMAAGIVWGAVAWLTFIAFFPAMWVIPGEVIRVIFDASLKLAEEGQSHYFLGQITEDPGLLFYPIGWLLRASPLEMVGLLGALVAGWRLFQTQTLARQVVNRPVEMAFVLFIGLLGLFLVASDKKLVRYFLPAIPLIDVFATMGLYWLLGKLSRFFDRRMIRRWSVPVVAGIILLGQGWLALDHYPYFFTYYNPLAGGTQGAARLMTIEGWGEGLNEAAAYLNRKPAAKSLWVVVERYCTTFGPFFAGRVNCLNSNAGGVMRADYIIYYYNVVQREFHWLEQWHYFNKHHVPEHRVTLHGLDYVRLYRNPIQNHVDRKANSLPRVFTTFGYNLAGNGQLTLFWHNLGLEQRQLQLGVAPSNGVYAIDTPTASAIGQRQWLPCLPAPAFAEEVNMRKAIIESLCPLAAANLPPGLYDLQLGLSDGSSTAPLSSSLLGVILVHPNGHFSPVKLGQAPSLSVKG